MFNNIVLVKLMLRVLDIFFIFVGYGFGKCLLIIKVSFFVRGNVNYGIFLCNFVVIFNEY